LEDGETENAMLSIAENRTLAAWTSELPPWNEGRPYSNTLGMAKLKFQNAVHPIFWPNHWKAASAKLGSAFDQRLTSRIEDAIHLNSRSVIHKFLINMPYSISKFEHC
jgi:hypothetical protein